MVYEKVNRQYLLVLLKTSLSFKPFDLNHLKDKSTALSVPATQPEQDMEKRYPSCMVNVVGQTSTEGLASTYRWALLLNADPTG